jgi:hypothetical protein
VLLDKPNRRQRIFHRELLAFFVVSPAAHGRRSGCSAISLRHTEARWRHRLAQGGTSLMSLIARTTNCRASSITFVRLLDLTPSELQRCGADNRWSSRTAAARRRRAGSRCSSTASTNTFNKHVDAQSHPSVNRRAVAERVATFRSSASVEVAYQLRRINHHVKVFAARPQGSVCAPRAHDGDVAAVIAAAPWTSPIRRRACARSSSTTSG